MILTLALPPESLRQKVHTILPWAKTGEWRPLFGGRSNSAWHLTGDTPEQSVVLKLYRTQADNPLFPNDPQSEAQLLRHLAPTGIAPQLIDSFSYTTSRCNLYQAIPGKSWSDGVDDVAELIQTLHAYPIPDGLRPGPNGSAEVLAQADDILAHCEHAAPLRSLRPTQNVPPTDRMALLHCDIVASNLIKNETGLHLIDWQCPAMGDATEDLAVFLSPAMQTLYRGAPLTPLEVQKFLSHFAQEDSIRYRMLAPHYHYRMAAYCLWQAQNDRPDYMDGFAVELAALQAG